MTPALFPVVGSILVTGCILTKKIPEVYTRLKIKDFRDFNLN